MKKLEILKDMYINIMIRILISWAPIMDERFSLGHLGHNAINALVAEIQPKFKRSVFFADQKKKVFLERKKKWGIEPDVNRTRNLLIWSQTRYHCATDP